MLQISFIILLQVLSKSLPYAQLYSAPSITIPYLQFELPINSNLIIFKLLEILISHH